MLIGEVLISNYMALSALCSTRQTIRQVSQPVGIGAI